MSTIKKIRVSELRLGMFLVGFEGGWLASPFWSSRLLLANAADLKAARDSGVAECWIDTARGLDLPSPVTAAPPRTARTQVVITRTPSATPAAATLSEELAAAQRLCSTARQAIMTMFGEARLGNVIDTVVPAMLVDDIVASVERHHGALISLARLKAEDDYTYLHSVAVCALMVALAKAMKLPGPAVHEAGLSGLLHDIGKARIPLAILNKPASLDQDEFAIVKRHPEHGFEALLHGGVSDAVRQACLHHHERVDGSGYPDGQTGDTIPLMARMASVCDVYDAVTSDRPYKRGWDPAFALGKMISWHGHFDPVILSAFVGVVGIYPTGSLVRLKSGRLGVVVEQNGASYTKPKVRIFYCSRTECHLPPALLDLAQPDSDVLEGPADRSPWPAALIEGLWAGDLVR